MAVRREKIREQFRAAEQSLLEPGEQVVAGALTQAGPSPWLAGGIGFLIMYAFGMRIYFMTVTDRRVLFLKSSIWSARPKGLAFADPRDSVSLADVNVAAVWSKVRYTAGARSLRLNFHRIWRDDFEKIVQALRGAGRAPSGEPAPPPPPAS